MEFLSENRFAEKPRAPLGGSSGKGHSLQHCMGITTAKQTNRAVRSRSGALVQC